MYIKCTDMLGASSSILYYIADLDKVSCQGSLSFFPPHTSISSSEAERRNRISAVQRLRPHGVTWFYRGVAMVSPKSWLCFRWKRQLIRRSWPLIAIVQLPDFLRRHWARRIPLAETSGMFPADSCFTTSPLVMCFMSATLG